jgi:hypothetical protein
VNSDIKKKIELFL